MNNRRIIGIVFGIFIVLIMFGIFGFVYAQQSENKTNNNPIKEMGFVDANNNGICDHMESGDCPMLHNQTCPMMKQGNCPMMHNQASCPMNCPMMKNMASCPMMNKK
jgi:hypothetical protein